MKCTVYRSNKKTGAYVYCADGFHVSDLPDDLQKILGACEAVMNLDLDERKKLGSEDIQAVRENLKQQSYHLQMPPKDTIGVTQFG
ncbi:YcgL domain-containing protein [Marinicella gelatinilytica]|uniref:YcgL domain-containing protein n=1 Tax=Marinicella gelatinilytica TaxID=2996017 RepID=UPI002260BE70|nr:YcgL domain-containing protein [Marinicella gelatinilytica]MCX7544813.1 YcgL domain-containing protein [Marinicella gelatinilytica]